MPKPAEGLIVKVPSESRFRTRIAWLDGRHSFSFGSHWDPDNTHHGLLLVSNEDRVRPRTGIWHSEMNAADKEVHLVQMWVPPDTEAIRPGYEQLDVNKELERGGLVPIASGDPAHSAIRIRQKDATLWAGRLKAGESVKLPEASHVHLFVAKGSGSLEGAGDFAQGDAARLVRAGSPRWTAGPSGSEVLVWQTEHAE